MKKTVSDFIRVSCLILVFHIASAVNLPTPKWTVKNPFEQKVFIENKGQYEIAGKVESKDILFGARQDGLEYYFTKTGIWIIRNESVKRTEEEIDKLKQQMGENVETNESDDKEFEYKTVEKFHQINFVNSGQSTEIIGNNEVKQYYNYKTNGSPNIKASAYKKITYENLYPGIDMEFFFPTDKQGFEYSFIVHRGADISQIKMQYPLNKNIQLSASGDITILSDFGFFTDHSPIGIQSGPLKQIDCSFTLLNGTVQFKAGSYDKTRDLVIDPWTTTPRFSNGNKAYDVDWDNAGNCYVYGGNGPYQVLKFDNTGTLLWSYSVSFNSDLGLYGDFVVDKRSQSVYIIEGFSFIGSQMIKLNSLGTQVAYFNGNPNMVEMWRVAYSPISNRVIVAGGGTTNPSYTGYCIDTTFTILNPVNVVISSGVHDMWGITTDNSGNCYMATARSHNDPTHYDNIMLKLVPPALIPALWTVNDHHTFEEVTSVEYVGTNGFNGMTVSDTNLYTYDSYVLKEWGTTHGNLLDSLDINGDTTLPIYWGGLTSDSCGNIFLGSHDTIKEYNSNLTLLNYFVAPDSVYDVSHGNNDLLYACGNDFVSAFLLTSHLTSPASLKLCLGNSATLTAAGASTYTWSPSVGLNTTTGASVIATPSTTTTYTVICAGSLSCLANVIDTFKIAITVDTLPIPDVKVSPTSSTICFGKSITILANGATNYQWSPSKGLKSNTGDSIIASPTISTTYTVIGTDINGCFNSGQSVITVDTLPQVSVSPNYSFSCNGQSDTLVASGQSVYQWSPSSGLNTTTGDSVIATPTISTVYLVTVIGNNGCSNSAQSIIYIYPTPNLIITPPSPSVCPGDSISLDFSGADTYQWSPSTGLDSITVDSVIASPTISTAYTIIGTNYSGCADTVQTTVTVGLPKIIISPPSPAVCYGQSISLSASGANTFQWSPSIGLNTNTGDTVIANPTITTTYTIIGNNGCSDTTTTVVKVDSFPKINVPNSSSICLGQSVSLTASGAVTYQWSPSAGLNITTSDSVVASPTINTTYFVTGKDSLGCATTDSSIVFITVGPSKPTITQNGNVLTSSATQGNQWMRNDSTLQGATNQNYTIVIAGWYTVTAENPANGCSATSDSIYIIPTGINQLSVNSEQISIYPNPTSGEIILNISMFVGEVKDWNLQITDVLGRVIYSRSSLNYINTIDLSGVPSGVYFITVNTKTTRNVFPVIRQE